METKLCDFARPVHAPLYLISTLPQYVLGPPVVWYVTRASIRTKLVQTLYLQKAVRSSLGGQGRIQTLTSLYL